MRQIQIWWDVQIEAALWGVLVACFHIFPLLVRGSLKVFTGNNFLTIKKCILAARKWQLWDVLCLQGLIYIWFQVVWFVVVFWGFLFFWFFAVLFCQAPGVTTCQLKDSCVGMGWCFGHNEGNKTKQGVYRRDCSSESHAFSFPSHPSFSLVLVHFWWRTGNEESLGLIVWGFDLFFFSLKLWLLHVPSTWTSVKTKSICKTGLLLAHDCVTACTILKSMNKINFPDCKKSQ